MADRKLVKELKAKIEALVIAIPREVEAHQYYTDLSEQYEDESSREMFLFLAKQELNHKRRLEEILAGLERQLEKTLGE